MSDSNTLQIQTSHQSYLADLNATIIDLAKLFDRAFALRVRQFTIAHNAAEAIFSATFKRKNINGKKQQR